MKTTTFRAAAMLLALAAATVARAAPDGGAAPEERAAPYAMGAGTEGRHWLPERAHVDNPSLRYPVTIRDGVTVTARDGVKLDARLFLPTLEGGAKPTPCVLMSDGYGRTSNTGAETDPVLMNIASRGYAVMHLSLRGSGGSGGETTLYNDFGRDGADAVEWMAKQSWCDGNVGMVGPSLLGIAQWLTAKEAPPHLKAIVPQVACGDCYGLLWYPGGMMPGPGRDGAQAVARGAGLEYPSAIAHRDLDEWWRARTTLDADVSGHRGARRGGLRLGRARRLHHARQHPRLRGVRRRPAGSASACCSPRTPTAGRSTSCRNCRSSGSTTG